MLAREILWARSSSICSHTTGQKYLLTHYWPEVSADPDCISKVKPRLSIPRICPAVSNPLEVILMSKEIKIKATGKHKYLTQLLEWSCSNSIQIVTHAVVDKVDKVQNIERQIMSHMFPTKLIA